MKKDLLTGKSGKIGLIIKALLLFAAVFAAAVMFFALIMYIFAAGFKYSALFATLSAASGAFAAAFYLSGKNGSRRLAYGRGGRRNCFLCFNAYIADDKPRRTYAEHAVPLCYSYAVVGNRRDIGR